MKRLSTVLLFTVIISSLLYGCSDKGVETPALVDSPTGSEKMEKTGRLTDPIIVAYRNSYEIVIQDDDGWEIMLNLKRARLKSLSPTGYLYSYEGILIYKMSYYIIKGGASAIFDPINNILAVCGLDSAYNRGKIIYAGQVPSNGYEFTGTYHYNKNPNKMNYIDCAIIKGKFPNTNSPAALSREAIFEDPKDKLPKWDR